MCLQLIKYYKPDNLRKMKKQIVLMALTMLISIGAVFAQGGGQRQTPEEKTKETMEKMEPLKMDASTKLKAEVIITDFNNAQQKMMQEMRESGSFDRETFMVKRKELAGERDEKLKIKFPIKVLKNILNKASIHKKTDF